MNRYERKMFFRRIRREAKAADLRAKARVGSFNFTRESPISRSKYLGSNFAYLYNQVSNTRVLKRGDYIHTTPYNRQVRLRLGSGHIGYHYTSKNPADGYVSYGDGFLAIFDCGDAGIWSGYSDSSKLKAKLVAATQNAMLSKIAADYASWDALTDVVEGKQLASLLLTLARRFKLAAVGIARRDPVQFFESFGIRPTRRRVKKFHGIVQYHYLNAQYGKSVASAFSDLWLEYHWGIRPTVYSIEDALKVFCAPDVDKDYVFTTQVTLSDELSVTTPTFGSGKGLLTWNGSTTRTCKGSIRQKAYYRFAQGVKNRINANSAYTLITTTWELTPMSDVIDWFIGIGDYLSNLKLSEVLADVDVNVTEKGKTILVSVLNGYSTPYYVKLSDVQNYCTGYYSSWDSFYRSKGNTSIPAPTLEQGLYNFYRDMMAACLAWQNTKQFIKTSRISPLNHL